MNQTVAKVVRRTGVFATIRMFALARLDILDILAKIVYLSQDVSTVLVIKVSNVTATQDGEECTAIHVSLYRKRKSWVLNYPLA